MEQSHLCVENVGKHLQSKEIGEHTKRIVESCGIAPVVPTSNIRGRLKITSDPLGRDIIPTLLSMVLKMRRSASQGLMRNLLSDVIFTSLISSLQLCLKRSRHAYLSMCSATKNSQQIAEAHRERFVAEHLLSDGHIYV